MRWVASMIIGLVIFTGITGGAFLASARGFGLPGMLDKPVSIRQESTSGRRHSGGGFWLLYFSGRRHHGGGFRGGK